MREVIIKVLLDIFCSALALLFSAAPALSTTPSIGFQVAVSSNTIKMSSYSNTEAVKYMRSPCAFR